MAALQKKLDSKSRSSTEATCPNIQSCYFSCYVSYSGFCFPLFWSPLTSFGINLRHILRRKTPNQQLLHNKTLFFLGGVMCELCQFNYVALYIHSVIQGKCCLSKATPEELAAAGKPSASNPTAAKAKAKATARGTKKIQPPSPAHEETP